MVGGCADPESRAVLGEGWAVPWVRAHTPHGAGAGSSRTLPAFLVTNKRCISAQHGTRREEMRTAAGRWECLVLRWESALCCAVGWGNGVPCAGPCPAHLPWGGSTCSPVADSTPSCTDTTCLPPDTGLGTEMGLLPSQLSADWGHLNDRNLNALPRTGGSQCLGICGHWVHPDPPEVAPQGLVPITAHFSQCISPPCRHQLRHPLLPAGGLWDVLLGETEAGEADKICPGLCKNLRIIHSN